MTDFPNHVTESIHRAHARLDSHDGRLRTLELNEAGMAQQISHANEKLNGIQQSITWVLRLIVGGLIMAAITFIVSGGLNGTAQ
ncbi:MAG TPA: hypothetical protein DEB47_04785 [Citreicella sp.]|nr:hypothetical protein [Citreicella sp.]